MEQTKPMLDSEIERTINNKLLRVKCQKAKIFKCKCMLLIMQLHGITSNKIFYYEISFKIQMIYIITLKINFY